MEIFLFGNKANLIILMQTGNKAQFRQCCACDSGKLTMCFQFYSFCLYSPLSLGTAH